MQKDDPFNLFRNPAGLLGEPEDCRKLTLHLKDKWTNLLPLTDQGQQNDKHLARLTEHPQAYSWLWLQSHPQGSGLKHALGKALPAWDPTLPYWLQLTSPKVTVSNPLWEKPWSTLDSGSRHPPKFCKESCFWHILGKALTSARLHFQFSLPSQDAGFRVAPGKPTVLASDSALPAKPLGIHSLYRDAPTKGHAFKACKSDCFT